MEEKDLLYPATDGAPPWIGEARSHPRGLCVIFACIIPIEHAKSLRNVMPR